MAYSVHLVGEYKEENDVCKTLASFKTELAAIDLNFHELSDSSLVCSAVRILPPTV